RPAVAALRGKGKRAGYFLRHAAILHEAPRRPEASAPPYNLRRWIPRSGCTSPSRDRDGGAGCMKARADGVSAAVLYDCCRPRVPGVGLSFADFQRHLDRAFELYLARAEREQRPPTRAAFLETLLVLDWFLACACLDGLPRAWESLFASRASRTDCLLVDALR